MQTYFHYQFPYSKPYTMKWKNVSKNSKSNSNTEVSESFEESRWKFYSVGAKISFKARNAWEIGRKPGLHCKCSDEVLRAHLEILERRDMKIAKISKKKNNKGNPNNYQ